MRPIIHSTKHLVPIPVSSIGTAARENIILCQAVESTVANTAIEIVEGAVVKAVFVELWLNNDGVDGSSIVTLEKTMDVGLGPTFAEMASLFTYTNKKNILFTHQGLTSNESIGNPIPVMRNWFKIPKGKQRFGLGDKLVLSISNTSSGNLFRCGIIIFKEMT